jgi:uncharacterized protein
MPAYNLLDDSISRISVNIISFYQQYLSPYKGFRCAHSYIYGDESCSVFIKKVVSEEGLFKGYNRIKSRFADCRLAYETISKDKRDQKVNKRGCGLRRRNKNEKWYDNCDCSGCSPNHADCKQCFHGASDLPCDIGPCDCSP